MLQNLLANDTILCSSPLGDVERHDRFPSPHTNTALGVVCGAVIVPNSHAPILIICCSFCHCLIFFTFCFTQRFSRMFPLLNGLQRNYSKELLGSCSVLFLSPFHYSNLPVRKGWCMSSSIPPFCLALIGKLKIFDHDMLLYF